VVAAVCSELGLYLTSTGKTLPIYAMSMIENHSRAGSEVSQITLNTDARDAIRDLFPNIPDKDLNQIIKTAFQKVRTPIESRKTDVGNLIFAKLRAKRKSELPPNCPWLGGHSWQWLHIFVILKLTTIAS
jgi:hypothetical protein